MTLLNKISIYTIITMFTLNGCGGGSSATGENKGELPTVDVTYTLNGKDRPTCHNANDVGILNPTPNDYIFCIWLCGKYQGSNTIETSLTFEKNPKTEDGVWELTNELLREADASICRDI